MTYQEIKDRLSKCELTLEKFKNGVNIDNKEAQAKINKLTILKESLTKKLAEAQSKTYLVTPKSGQTTAVSMSDDETDALKDADDVKAIKGIDGEEIKEQEGVKFSIDETKAIAKKVGKAVAISLKSLGDAVKSMKAKNIEENSFDIQVNYKGEGPEDSFSFYIKDDTLHLTDFSFDKEITDVGVKPSGEAIVNVDVVANELQKHFKAMNEAEVTEAPDNMYYIKVPRKDKAQQNAVQNVIETFYDPVRFADIVDDDGAGNVIMYIHKKDFDEGMIDDLAGEGVDVYSQTNFPGLDEGDGMSTKYKDSEGDPTNMAYTEKVKEDKDIGHQDDEPSMLGASALETAEYAAKLYKKLQRYDNFDGEVDFPHWWQKKLVLARDYMSAAFHYLDSEEKQPAIDKLALEENVDKVAGGIPYKREGNKFTITEPLDDATKERIMKRAKEHGHHAAPNQAGGVTIMAKEGKYKSDAQRKAIYAAKADKVNEGMDVEEFEREYLDTQFGSSLADDYPNTKKYTIQSLFDSFKELRKKKNYDFEEFFEIVDNGKIKRHSAGKLLKFKAEENINEELSDDQRDALEELEDILNQAGDLGNQARDIIAQSFPNYLSQGDAYGAFNFGDSSNSYDTTLSSIVQSIYDGDEDMDEGRNVDDLYDTTIHTMKRLAAKYKAGDKSVVPHLKKLTNIKKKLEQEKIKKASNIGKGQELTEGRGDMDAIKRIIDDRAAESGFEEREEAAEVIAAIAEEYMLSLKVIQAYMDSDGPVNPHDINEIELSKKQISKLKDIVKQLKKSVKGHDAQQKYINKLVKKEAAPGFKHDCAAKVVHEKYGNGTCIPEKHTLVKEGNKYVVTHYDVLFENGNTVLDIPVSELEIKTQTEHWHKGYKKKKK